MIRPKSPQASGLWAIPKKRTWLVPAGLSMAEMWIERLLPERQAISCT